MKNLKQNIHDLRFWLFVAAFVLMFMVWAEQKYSTTVDMGVLGKTYQPSGSVKSTGLSILLLSYVGYIGIVFPIAAIVREIFDFKFTKINLLYILGSFVSIIGMAFSMMQMVGLMNIGPNVESVSSSTSISIFFWIELLVYIAIIILSAKREYGISKKDIREKGIKAVVGDTVSGITRDTISIKNDIKGLRTEKTILSNGFPAANVNVNTANKTGSEGSVCPNCGNPVPSGKKFCGKCGTKIKAVTSDITNGNSETSKNTDENNAMGSRRNTVSHSFFKSADKDKTDISIIHDGMTVLQYISMMKYIKCPTCGKEINSQSKFCPECGSVVKIMVEPEICGKCGEKLIKGKPFCPNCGSQMSKVQLIPFCPKCNAELLYGKNFCVECGEKIENDDVDENDNNNEINENENKVISGEEGEGEREK